MKETSPPLIHIGLGGLVALVFIIGGEAMFGNWGRVPVRPLALYALASILLHAFSRFIPHGIIPRGAAWLVLLLAPLHLTPLLRVDVMAPIAAVGVIDLLLFQARSDIDVELEASTKAKAVAGLWTIVSLCLLAVLVLVSRDAFVLLRLGTVVLVAWALVTILALQPHHRTPSLLLGSAGALSVTFYFLASPLLPFGPLFAYALLVTTVSLAIIASTMRRTRAPLEERYVRHEQTVRPLPDPVTAPLATRIERFLETGHGDAMLSRRLERLLGRPEDGSLLSSAVRSQQSGSEATRRDREAALASVLQIDTASLPESDEP